MDNTKEFTHLGLCAGYGGIELGLQRVIRNLRTVALCEIEAFACANLVAKMEAGLMDCAPIWTNLKTFPWSDFRDRVDILTGGYPCQPFSAAGKRLGTEDPRHLWPFIADGIRILRPKLCFFENVEGHISLGLREVIGELESIGYTAAWGIFSASEVGAPHQRKRVFILAYDQHQGLERLGEFCPSLGRSNERLFIGNGCSREELANDSGAGLQGREWFRQTGTQGESGGYDSECGGAMADSIMRGMSRSRNEFGDIGEAGQGRTHLEANSHIAWPSRPGELADSGDCGRGQDRMPTELWTGVLEQSPCHCGFTEPREGREVAQA